MPFGKCLVFGEKASEMMSKKSGDESHFNNITEKSVHSLNGISGYSERSRISGNQGLNLLFNNLHEGVILLNRYGVIQEWNPVMEQFYGYLREDCVGKVFQEIVHQLFHETVFESAQYKKFIKAVKSLSAWA